MPHVCLVLSMRFCFFQSYSVWAFFIQPFNCHVGVLSTHSKKTTSLRSFLIDYQPYLTNNKQILSSIFIRRRMSIIRLKIKNLSLLSICMILLYHLKRDHSTLFCVNFKNLLENLRKSSKSLSFAINTLSGNMKFICISSHVFTEPFDQRK